jgi:chemotaxis-related protein WspB
MLLLLFEIGNGRYALDVNQIIEIVPLVKLKKIPTTPDYVAGLMNYRGEGSPVIDLCRLLEDSPFEDALSTRIMIIRYPVKDLGDKPLGLIANNVTETVRTQLSKPPPAGVLMDKKLYDGEEAPETSEMIQWFDIKKMLPEKEISVLFEEEE